MARIRRSFAPMGQFVLKYDLTEKGIKNMGNQISFQKPRLFVDMDGVLCTFEKATMEVLSRPGYFAELSPQENVVAAIRMLARSCCVEVFVLSCYIAETNAKAEKNAWLDRYLPEVDTEHRIFVPCGEGKDEYVPGCVLPTDTLLDDYSVNLHSWKAAGGNAVKLRNGINGNHGTWEGPSVDMKYQPGMLSCCVLAHAIRGADRHDRAAKEVR